MLRAIDNRIVQLFVRIAYHRHGIGRALFGRYLAECSKTGYSSRLGRKFIMILTSLLDLIEPLLEERRIGYVRLDGSVPQKKRQALIHQFQNDTDCMLFRSTNAGATDLNLQAANTVINVDLPWNPAVLEQRIGRAHRMGQKSPVHVTLLVTSETLEENLLANLSAKHELSLAVLDPEADATAVDLTTGIEELKRRMEILLGARPEAAEDESMKIEVEKETAVPAKKEKIAAAGGKMVSAAPALIGEMFAGADDDPQTEQSAGAFRARLSDCMEKAEDGSLKMTITLPDEAFLDNMARSLAKMLGTGLNPSP